MLVMPNLQQKILHFFISSHLEIQGQLNVGVTFISGLCGESAVNSGN